MKSIKEKYKILRKEARRIYCKVYDTIFEKDILKCAALSGCDGDGDIYTYHRNNQKYVVFIFANYLKRANE